MGHGGTGPLKCPVHKVQDSVELAKSMIISRLLMITTDQQASLFSVAVYISKV